MAGLSKNYGCRQDLLAFLEDLGLFMASYFLIWPTTTFRRRDKRQVREKEAGTPQDRYPGEGRGEEMTTDGCNSSLSF